MRLFVVQRVAALFAAAALFAVALVMGSSTEAEAQTATDQQVVQEARGWIGAPYVLGGSTSPNGIDCSGLTMSVMGKFGVALPDSPAAQYNYGTPSDAGAGDLVFFTDGTASIVNVGIATGQGTVISANHAAGQVVEVPMSYYSGYVGAKDVV